MAELSSRAQTVEKAYASVAEAIGGNPYDIPFAAIYQVTADRNS
jgi:hypothetical protein